jgi:Ni/Fe-hydrogenase subunit HybB-like protein
MACILLNLGGLVGAPFCLYFGLNQTGMNDYFAFGLWIVVDLAVIALGAGAFFTGFLTYVVGKKELTNIINAAVIIGFICYSGAIVAMLGIDIGQPARGWFIFWHANVHSMLTEVSFCITTYLIVLTIEFVPIILENRQISTRCPNSAPFRPPHAPHHDRVRGHRHLPVLLPPGFSLGGMYGVLYARPFADAGHRFRHLADDVLSCSSCRPWPRGPCLTLMIATFLEKIGRKRLVKDAAKQLLAKIAGRLLLVYIILKIIDTIAWVYGPAHSAGFSLGDFFREGPYGWWTLIAEVGVFGVIPAIILNIKGAREREGWLMLGCFMNCVGIVLNRFVMTVVTLAIPVMPFDKFLGYLPTWQEWAIALAVVGYGGIVLSLSYRYLPVFPDEAELNA